MNNNKRQIGSIPPEMIAVAVNRTMLYLAVLTVTVIFLYASLQPRPVLLPAMSSLLTICAFAAGALALIRVQPLNAPYLTSWDLSALWLFVAIGLGMLSDSDAVEAYLASVSTSATAELPMPAPAENH